jgi:hypothetical protein
MDTSWDDGETSATFRGVLTLASRYIVLTYKATSVLYNLISAVLYSMFVAVGRPSPVPSPATISTLSLI